MLNESDFVVLMELVYANSTEMQSKISFLLIEAERER